MTDTLWKSSRPSATIWRATSSVLRSECDRLSAALSEIQRDHRNLREVTSHVAQRIDGSIAEIDRLLEG